MLNKYNHIYPLLESSLIEYFILNLCENKEQSKWIINWIASFFQTSHKSNTALVLIGDKETTDVLINQIIKPIFIARKEYFCVIDDEMLEKSSEDKILKNRIFYHIDELSDKNINSKKTSNIVRKILSQNRLDILESEVYGDIYIHGELLVTSNDKTPYPFLKDSYRSCEVFNVKSLSSILKNLNMDRITFDTNIQNDLNNWECKPNCVNLKKAIH